MSTLPAPHPYDTVDFEENSRNRNVNMKIRDESASIKDIEMIDTKFTRGARESTRDGTNHSLPCVPSPPLSPLGIINDYNKPDSFYMLKKEKEQTKFDYNDDCPHKNNSTAADAATIANHMHMNNESSGDNDDECIDGNLSSHENDNVSPSDKQFRLFNIKI